MILPEKWWEDLSDELRGNVRIVVEKPDDWCQTRFPFTLKTDFTHTTHPNTEWEIYQGQRKQLRAFRVEQSSIHS